MRRKREDNLKNRDNNNGIPIISDHSKTLLGERNVDIFRKLYDDKDVKKENLQLLKKKYSGSHLNKKLNKSESDGNIFQKLYDDYKLTRNKKDELGKSLIKE